MQGVLTERWKHGSLRRALHCPWRDRSAGAILCGSVFDQGGNVLVLAAIAQVICAFQRRGGPIPHNFAGCAIRGGRRPATQQTDSRASAVTALTGFWERTLDRRSLDVGGGLVTVAVRRPFDARIGARLTRAGAFRPGSEPAASGRVHPGS